jgi:hypothetical protein
VALAHPQTVVLGVVRRDARARRRTGRKGVWRTRHHARTPRLPRRSLGAADATVGWSVFARWQPERLEAVPLPPAEIARLGAMGIAVTTQAKDPAAARRFIDFTLSPAGRARFEALGYHTTAAAAFAECGGETPVGGDYAVPEAPRRSDRPSDPTRLPLLMTLSRRCRSRGRSRFADSSYEWYHRPLPPGRGH